jgi:hypothetical protein
LPDRIANKVVLAEDVEQQNLVRRYLEQCGHDVRGSRFLLAAKRSGGSGEKYVRDQYPQQVQACRSALGKKASALLVVIIDADMEPTQARKRQLSDALRAAQLKERRDDDPDVVLLIPKRHAETWIRALLGNHVDEVTDYSRPAPIASEIRGAAVELYAWTRPGASPGATSPPSLTDSLPEWRKIPS